MLGVVPEPGASLSRGGLSSRSLALASSRGEDAGGRRPGSSEGRKGRRNYVGENSARTAEAKENERRKSVLYKKKLEQRRALMQRSKDRIERIVRILLFTGGFVIFLVLAAAAVALEMVELCRFPVYELCEDFLYKIDVEFPVATDYPRFEVKDNKVMKITGGQIDELVMRQNYGTYTLVADHDPKQEHIRFRVCNRATNKYWLNKISSLDATNVEITQENGVKKWMTNVELKSETSNEMTGSLKCRRADITVFVPTACLLEETKVKVRVEKGDVVIKDIKNSTVNTFNVENNKGDIDVNGLMGERVNLNTTKGKVDAINVTAHHMFLLAQEEGGTVRGRYLSITDGENKKSCRNNTYYMPGFPKEPIYLRMELVCDKEPGELTIDARGSEGDIVDIDRVVGGNIIHFNKIGNTNIRLMACYDFVGEFGLATRPGLGSKYKVVMEKSKEQIYEESMSIFGIDPSKYPPYFKYKPDLVDNMVMGEVCGPNSRYPEQPAYFKAKAENRTMILKTNGTGATGTITLTIVPPSIEDALPQAREYLKEGLKQMPPPPPQFVG